MVAMRNDPRLDRPLTDVETPVPDGRFIYSRTDKDGTIVAANDLFVELSGFSREELVGRPHNLVRHPDMPKEAFSDLWRCLKAGDPWSGYIKNRRKDGGYYWVHAFTSPLRENGKVVGYESVRRKAPRDIVDRVADGYRRIKGGAPLSVDKGRLVRKGLAGALGGIGLGTRLRGALGIGALLMLFLFVRSLVALSGLEGGVPAALLVELSVAFAATLLLFGYLGIGMAGGLLRDLKQLRDAMSATQRDGDLRRVVRLLRRDEVGRMADAYNAMMANLQAILINVQQAAGETGAQSRSVASASGSVAGQASAVSDASASTAAAVEQVTVAIGEVASNVQEAAQAARTSASDAQQGIDTSRRAAQDIRALADTVQHTTSTVERLSDSAGHIGRIVDVISEIASQTNLLALNAAIEAARAGEQGRGFAVVADEVRKLSERTNQSTAEITGIIAALNTETRAALDSIKAGDAQVRISVDQVLATEQALEGIKASAANSLMLIDGIELATREQSSAANEIARNVEQIARMSEQSAGAIHGIAGSSQALAGVAAGLNETLSRVQV
ncbi:MAG: PAS domain-containing methyl-accepting chemotaxis protein [bacterium]|nr:methyl-accepting chemotaxis protein [Betaproteobacteria bacterium]